MNKKHWITVQMDNSIPDAVLKSWIEESYRLVAKSLTKSQKTNLESL